MNTLEKLQQELDGKEISVTYKKIKNEKVEQERVYINLDKQFLTYFIIFEENLFLKVYIARPKGFDFTGVKQSAEETERCKKAKLKILDFLKKENATSLTLEKYEAWNKVNLTPTSSKKKLDLE